MGIEYERRTQSATFYSPLEDFAETTVEVEIRSDPLTGRRTRIVPDNFILPGDEPDIDAVVGDAEGCFFCPDMVGDATPKYPDFVGQDRGSVGEATAFPNLNPYGSHSNVVVLTEDHYVPIDEFTADIFSDGFHAALEYVTAVFEHDEAAEVASINMNFLRPAGSSIIHPHVQTLVDDRGTKAQGERFRAARTYYDQTGGEYFGDLLDAERGTDRFVGETGGVSWLAPFAPRHHRHVVGIADDVTTPAPADDTVRDFAEGLVAVLSYYGDLGLNSFNFGLHLVDEDEAIRPVIDVVARSVFDQYYWSDATFFETVHDESVLDVPPEEYATAASAFF